MAVILLIGAFTLIALGHNGMIMMLLLAVAGSYLPISHVLQQRAQNQAVIPTLGQDLGTRLEYGPRYQ